jgi:hypothetical protein
MPVLLRLVITAHLGVVYGPIPQELLILYGKFVPQAVTFCHFLRYMY